MSRRPQLITFVSTLAGCLALALGPRPVVAADRGPRLAVIAVGEDPENTGELQFELEARVRSNPSIQVRSTAESGPLIGLKAVDEGANKRARRRESVVAAKAMLSEVKAAYYEKNLTNARSLLAQLQVMHSSNAEIPTAERVQVYLWRAAVQLADKDLAGAEFSAQAALTLNPSLNPGKRDFPPSVTRLIEETREKKLEKVTLTLTDLPPNAQIIIDDAFVSERTIKIPVGRHFLRAEAPYCQPLTLTFTIFKDQALPVHLPLALEGIADGQLRALLTRGALTQDSKEFLRGLAHALDVDGLVIAARLGAGEAGALTADRDAESDRRYRALIWWRNSAIESTFSPDLVANEAGVRSLAHWVSTTIARPSTWRVVMGGGPHVRYWRARVGLQESTGAGDCPSGSQCLQGVGVGAQVAVAAQRGPSIVEASLGAESYALNLQRVTLSTDGTDVVSTNMGALYAVRVLAGRVFRLDQYGLGPTLGALAGVGYSVYNTNETIDPQGPGEIDDRLNPFPDVNRLNLSAIGRVTYPLDPSLTAWGELEVTPLSFLTETPPNARGKEPKSYAGAGRIGVRWEAPQIWTVRLFYEGSYSQTRFHRNDSLVLTSSIRNPLLTEQTHGIFTVAERQF